MDILNKLTIESLKLNKKRTIVTIIGIALSVALICAITTFTVSFQQTLIDGVAKKDGSFHIKVEDVAKDKQDYIKNNIKLKECGFSKDLGYSLLKNSKNEYKPYLSIKALDDVSLNNMGINVTEGRLPENENELVISSNILTNGKVNFKIGDKISLDIGKIYIGNYELNQDNPYYTDKDIEEINKKETSDEKLEKERFENEYAKEYTIVGIMDRPGFESYSSPGFTVVTKLSNDTGDLSDMVLVLKNSRDTYKVRDTLIKEVGIKKENISTNDELLRFQGITKDNETRNVTITLLAIVIGIIVFTSVFVIRNSFNISITERLKQYGMLSSIGATSKQIKKNIKFEALILGVIAIPLGIVIGILAIWLVIVIVNALMQSVGIIDSEIRVVVSFGAILVAVLISVITIYISSLKPAKKASKISPIEAIRNSGDIKISNKKLKTSKLFNKLFGIEGQIASKNLKRSKKKYRTTIFSIVISIVLFIAMNSFINYGFKISSLYYKNIGYNISIYDNNSSESVNDTLEYYNKICKLDNIKEYALVKRNVAKISMNYLTDKSISGYQVMDDENTGIDIIAVGNDTYRKYIKDLGLNYDNVKDKGILVDKNINIVQNDGKTKRIEYNKFNLKEGDTLEFKNIKKEEKVETIQIAKRVDKTPMGIYDTNPNPDYLIVSDEYIEKVGYTLNYLYINSHNPTLLEENIKKIDESRDIKIFNLEDTMKQENTLVLIISIFLYGFIGVITVIGITNIFNTITTNMALRNREFAILKSIGMTNKEFKKMINYESILYGTKALLFGTPIGVALSYWMYKVIGNVYESMYKIPWDSILICVIFVFAIIFITMKYSISKSKKQNIIETIRSENV